MIDTVPQPSSIIPITKSLTVIQYSQPNISVISEPSSHVTIVSDTHTIISSTPVTTVSVVECVITSSSVVTSISGQDVSTITAGMYAIIT